MTILTPARLAEIEARHARTTSGDWIPKVLMVTAGRETVVHFGVSNSFRPPRPHECEANAAFTAHAHQDIPALLASHAALQAEVERLKNGIPESDPARLARPPAPNGDVTNVGTQSVARLIQRVNEYACFDERLRQLMREVSAELTTARASAAREMRERCAEDNHDWSSLHVTHRCDKCGEER